MKLGGCGNGKCTFLTELYQNQNEILFIMIVVAVGTCKTKIILLFFIPNKISFDATSFSVQHVVNQLTTVALWLAYCITCLLHL